MREEDSFDRKLYRLDSYIEDNFRGKFSGLFQADRAEEFLGSIGYSLLKTQYESRDRRNFTFRVNVELGYVTDMALRCSHEILNILRMFDQVAGRPNKSFSLSDVKRAFDDLYLPDYEMLSTVVNQSLRGELEPDEPSVEKRVSGGFITSISD